MDPVVVVPQIHGRRALDSIMLLAPHLDIEAENIWLREAEASDTDGVVPIEGAMEFVASLPAERWSIVTSGAKVVATARLGAVGLEPFCAVYADDVERGKPHPDPYLLAAKKLGFVPEACVVFEDVAAGVAAGHAAGMKVIAVTSGADRPDLQKADMLIPNFNRVRINVEEDEMVIEIGY
jgi:sugar-phosphatase